MNRNILIRELREHGILNDIPNISDVNMKFLCDVIRISGTRDMLEIGSANGFSGICF